MGNLWSFWRWFGGTLAPVPTFQDYEDFGKDLKKVDENLGRIDQQLDRYSPEFGNEPPVNESDLAAWNTKLEQLRRMKQFLGTNRAHLATLEFRQNVDMTEARCNVVVNKMRRAIETAKLRSIPTTSVTTPKVTSVRRLVHTQHSSLTSFLRLS
jgi:hypothetical protein